MGKVRILAVGTAVALLSVGVLLFVLGVLPGTGNKEGNRPAPAADEEEGGPETPIKAIHPRQDAALTVSVEQILSVEPLFQADLRAQVAGVVHSVPYGIGDPVHRDELLIGLDVPDLAVEVLQKEAIIRQRETEVRLAED